MQGYTAYVLTELFKNKAPNRRLDFRTVKISVETQGGSTVAVTPRSPMEAAAYLGFFKNTTHQLFTPAQVTKDLKEPVIFSVEGDLTRIIAGQYRKEYRFLNALTLRFFEASEGARGQVLFQEEFGDFGPKNGFYHPQGPVLNEFIRALYHAGEDWRGVNLLAKSPRRFMQIVQKP